MQLLDSTLREGELFRVLPRETRVKVASRLGDAGIRRVELTVDYPPRTAYEDNVPVIRALLDRGVDVVMHGRATDPDIEAISRYDVDGCALYIAVSRLHREFKLHGITEEEAVKRLCDGVAKAKDAGFGYIRATMEDASREYLEEGDPGLEKLRASSQMLRTAGATLLSLPDTSGLMTPNSARSLFRKAKSVSSLPLSAHFHNDYGFASANTVEAALEGAQEVHATLMGIGDRNGIADLYEVAATLEDAYGVRTGIDRRSLRPLYSFFSKAVGLEMNWRHPLSESAQTVRAGVHQSMTVKRRDGYIPAKKLLYDFGEPLYAITAYTSHNLVQAILAPYSNIGPEESRRVAEALAAKFTGTPLRVQAVREVIMNETGVEVPEHELRRYFASEKLYIMLKLRPQYPTESLIEGISALEDVDGVDEVYGDADMVVRAHTPPGRQSVVSIIRQKYGGAIEDMKVLVTD